MRLKSLAAGILMGSLLLGTSLSVCAEEAESIEGKQVAGYHIYEVEEAQATDTWYASARGVYLQAGIAKILEGKSSRYAVCSGTTFSQMDCDRVYVRVYLDESDTGTGAWSTLDYWTGIAYNDTIAAVDSGNYRITKGKYYRATGSHSAKEGDVVEATTTCTNALLFD